MGRRPLAGRRAEICRTAAQIIRERGFDATSLTDVAAALGMSKSGLNHYTPSKDALLFEIMMFGLDQIEAEVVSPVRGIADPEQRLYGEPPHPDQHARWRRRRTACRRLE